MYELNPHLARGLRHLAILAAAAGVTWVVWATTPEAILRVFQEVLR